MTARAPVNGTLADGASESYVHAPAAVVVGRSSSPQATTGTLANLEVPVTATGSTGAPTSSPSGASVAPSGGTSSGIGPGSSSLIDATAPVQVSPGGPPAGAASGLG